MLSTLKARVPHQDSVIEVIAQMLQSEASDRPTAEQVAAMLIARAEDPSSCACWKRIKTVEDFAFLAPEQQSHLLRNAPEFKRPPHPLEEKLEEERAKHAAEIAAKDAEIASKDVEIEKLKRPRE